jgi:iron complex outermembrane receptor protein
VPLLNANIANDLDRPASISASTTATISGSWASLSYFLAGSYLIKSVVQSSPIVNPVDCAGYIGGGSCGNANPTWRFTQRLTWDVTDAGPAFAAPSLHRFGEGRPHRRSDRFGRGDAVACGAGDGPDQLFRSERIVRHRQQASAFRHDRQSGRHNPPFQLYERETYDAIGRRFTIGFRKKF